MAWWIFQNVVVTAALALVVAMVCRASLFRIGPVVRHALWLVVLVKFVTPPLVVWPWAMPDPLGVAAFDTRADDRALRAEMPPAIDLAPVTIGIESAASSGPVDDVATVGSLARAATPPSAVFWSWFFGMWVVGSLLLCAIESVRLARLMQRVKAATPTDPEITRRVADLSAQMGLTPVPVVTIAGTSSPAIWCFGRTRLLWPADLPADSSDACMDGLIVHELAHVKRRDHLVGWLELAAGIVWWWNPLFWFVRSALREQAELACDAWVISALPNGRRAYAESLLTLSGAAMRGASSMALLGIRATSRRVLERRLVMIMKGRSPLRLPWVGLVSLTLVAAATLPAWATGSQQTPPPPPPAAAQPAPAPPIPVPVAVAPSTAAPSPARSAPALPVPVAASAPSAMMAPPSQQMPPPPPPKATSPTPQKTSPATPVKVAPAPAAEVAVPVQGGTPRPGTVPARSTPSPMRGMAFTRGTADLPAEGQELVKGFETQREAILKEIDQKIAASQEAVIKSLQALQDKYTKEGKLDEAVAIRDYLRAGGPGRDIRIRVPGLQNNLVIRR